MSVDGGVVADFAGLDQLVDSVGGIDLYVDEPTASVHIGWTKGGRFQAPYRIDATGAPHVVPGVTPKVYPVGYQHLTGWEAVDYLRQRHVRQFLAALLKPVTPAETGLMTALAHDDLAAWVARTRMR